MREIPPFVSHGTTNAYTNYDCRCERCKEAQSAYLSAKRSRNNNYQTYMREYMRKYRARLRAQADEEA